MEKLLDHFIFSQFLFLLKPIETIHLPSYKGSAIRGGFGATFKKVVCINKDNICESCLLKRKCVYSYIFETPLPSESSIMRKYPFAPHPFVITPPLEDKREYLKGEDIIIELTLFGRAIDYLPYFIFTFDEFGRNGIGKGRGRYLLEEVKISNGELIYSSRDKILKNLYHPLTIHELKTPNISNSRIKLSFLTPTRVKFGGKLAPSIEFHILITNLLRRISLLSYFHCGKELDLDFKGFIEEAKDIKTISENISWFDWERYSGRQKTRMKMGGFIGSITFEGELKKFIPFLLLGEYTHIGKGTSFGLGKYKILNLEF